MGQKVRLRPIVPGHARGPVVKSESLSFYGEVDPERGVILGDGRSITGKILVIGRSRGSTVGSYVIYGLRYYGKQPRAIVMVRSEPIVIVGAILAGIPLYEGLPPRVFEELEDGACMEVRPDGTALIGGRCSGEQRGGTLSQPPPC